MSRTTTRILITTILLTAVVAAWADPAIKHATVEIRKSNQVRGAQYTLGDIAIIRSDDAAQKERLKSLVLGKSPSLGYSSSISPGTLARNLDRMGISEEATIEIPKYIYLQREAQTLDMRTLGVSVEEEYYSATSLSPENLLIENIRLPRAMRLPAGDLAMKIEYDQPARGYGNVPFRVKIAVDGEPQHDLNGSMSVDRLIDALQLEKSVARNESARPDCWKSVRVKLSQLRGKPLTAIDARQSLLFKRDMSPGEIVTWDEVEREPLVLRGQKVQIVLISGSMRIATLGTARAGGALGDPVEVINAKSGKSILGTVMGRQMVRITF